MLQNPLEENWIGCWSWAEADSPYPIVNYNQAGFVMPPTKWNRNAA